MTQFGKYFLESKRLYFKEVDHLKYYILPVIIVIILSYSIYIFLDTILIARLGEENNLFESLTAISLLAASIIIFIAYTKTKYIFLLILSIVLFLGCGEEISWGQRFLQYDTPEVIKELNVQDEFNIHNIKIFNTHNSNGSTKMGLQRLFEINFLFRVFTVLFGFLLPFIVYHFKFIKGITQKIKLPVPPISIGIFFLGNWLIYRLMHKILLPEGQSKQYYDTLSEIAEFVAAFILMLICIYFLKKRDLVIWGTDIKHNLIRQPYLISGKVFYLDFFKPLNNDILAKKNKSA